MQMLPGRKYLLSGVAGLALLGTIVGSVAAAPAQQTPPEPRQQQLQRHAGMGGGFMGYRFSGGMLNIVADALNMTVDAVQAQRLAGESLAQIAQAQGVQPEALVEAMVQPHQEALAAQVEAGRFTQEQADAWLAQMRERKTEMVERTAVGPCATTGAPNMRWGQGGQAGPSDETNAGRQGFGRGMMRGLGR
jgi:hypothetical protein